MKFVAIGTDGVNPVIWGVGETEEEARADAERWMTDFYAQGELEELKFKMVSDERAHLVLHGKVEADDLWGEN